MDKLGLGMLSLGIICILAGAYGMYYFLDEAIEFIKGGIGLAFLGAGCVFALLGALLVTDEC